MSNTIGSLNIKIGVDSAPAAAGFKELTGELKVFVHQVEGVKPAGLKDTVDHLKNAADAADKAKGSVGGLWDKLKGLAGSAVKGGIAGIAAGLTLGLGSVGVGGLGEVLGGSVDLAAKAEASAMAFEVMTGSAERAKEVMRDIRTYAKESPFGVEGTTKATRGLIAYGLAAEKAVPTVRMLGDVAAASGDDAGETLDRLVLAYGQVYTAGRLMGTELKQFTEAGVPLIDELAKVMKRPKAEIKSLAETGKVGFREVALAFRGMTAAGGRFAGMSEKYADTFQGTIDRLTDGIDDLKREFGVALIEELGLKDAAKDGEKFAGEMKRLVADLRPAIRFVGDLGRGIGQVLGEGVRNAPLFAQVFGAALRKASPELAAYADRAVKLIQDLRDFKLDPDQVIDFAVDLGVALGRVVDNLITDLGGGLQSIYEQHVKPIVDAMKDAAKTWADFKTMIDGPANAWDAVKWKHDKLGMKDRGEIPNQPQFVKDMTGNPTLDRWWQSVKKKEFKPADELRKAGVPEEVIANQSAVRDRLVDLLRDLDAAQRELAEAEFTSKFDVDLVKAKKAFNRIAELKKQLSDLGRDAAGVAQFSGMTGDLIIRGENLSRAEAPKAGPLEARARQMKDWAAEEKKLRDAFRAGRDDKRTMGGGLRFGLDFTNAANAAAKALGKARKELEGLAVLPDMPAAAVDTFVAPQLPPVVEYGTAEFARLAGQAMSQPLDTEADLLRRILSVNEEQRDALVAARFAPAPVPVRLSE